MSLFFDVAHAKQRIQHSLIRRDGEVVYILNVESARNKKLRVAYTRLRDGFNDDETFDEARYDLSPVPLGNVNYKGEAIFLARTPARMWKQGLSHENVTALNRYGPRRFDISSKAILSPIDNSYPDIDRAIKSVATEEADSMAFSRYFSIGKGNSLFYKAGKVIGGVEDEKQIRLNPDYEYFKEMLQEVIDESYRIF